MRILCPHHPSPGMRHGFQDILAGAGLGRQVSQGQMRGSETCWHMTYLVQRDGTLPNQLQEKLMVGHPPTTRDHGRDHGTEVPESAQPRASLRRESTAWPGVEKTRLGFGGIGGKFASPRAEDRMQNICNSSGYITGFRSFQDAGCLHDTTLSSWSKRPAPHVPRRLHTAISQPTPRGCGRFSRPRCRWIPRLSIFLFSFLKINPVPPAVRSSCRTSLCFNRFLPSCCEPRPTCPRNARAWLPLSAQPGAEP